MIDVYDVLKKASVNWTKKKTVESKDFEKLV